MQNTNVPKGWNIKSMGDCFRFLRTKSFSRAETECSGDVKYVHYGDIHTKYPLIISPKEIDLFISTEQAINADLLRSGDLILLDASEDYEGTTKCIELSNVSPEDKIVSGLHTIALRDDHGVFANNFKAYLTSMPYVKQNFWKQISGVKVYGISKDNLKKIKVLVPPIEEQKKIAEILGTWDRAIEELTGLIAEKKELKRGLMQQLLTGIQRLAGFTKPWKKVKINTFLREISEKTTLNNQHKVLSVTKNGVCSQEDYFEKQIASENNIGYKILRKHNLVFSPMNLWMGSLGFSDYDIGIVSPAYKIFIVDESVTDYRFLKYFMITPQMIYMYKVNSEIGASIVRRNLDLDGLLSSFVRVPDFEEQKAIADVLSKADSEIDLLNQQLNVLREQKRGLMQKLLTGEIRVKVDTETC